MLEIITFLCGAAVMILELAGARMLAPYIGTSFIVWTSLIGVIMASLSLGYWLGGKLSDKNPNSLKLSAIILLGGISVLFSALTQFSFLTTLVQAGHTNLYLMSIYATIRLYAIPSVILGMISPYVIKVSIQERNLDTSSVGSTVGKFYAISTIGSILGTFLCGFVLVIHLGVSTIFYSIAAIIILSSILALIHSFKSKKANIKTNIFLILQLALLVSCFFFVNYYKINPPKIFANQIYSEDSQYQFIAVVEKTYRTVGLVRAIYSNINIFQSVMYLDTPYLTNRYIRLFDSVEIYNENQKSVLLLGCGGGSQATKMLGKADKNNVGDLKIDMVEIDPVMVKIAKKYFLLKDNPNLTLYYEDARTYVNRLVNNKEKNKYDAIYIDVFTSDGHIPFQLVTLEFFNNLKYLLNEKGAISINIISSVEGDNSLLFKSIYKTIKEVFPYIKVFHILKNDFNSMQNVVITASVYPPNEKINSPDIQDIMDYEYKKPIESSLPVFTDNYAPVEKFFMKEKYSISD